MVEQTQTLEVDQLSTDEVLDHLVNIRQAMARLKATDDALLDRLDQLAKAGQRIGDIALWLAFCAFFAVVISHG